MALTQAVDYYRVLQVDPDAEPEVVSAAYRKLAAKYHPDVNGTPDAAERMKEINQAYAVLGDSEQRAAYDRARGESVRWMPGMGGQASAGPPRSQTEQLARSVVMMIVWSIGFSLVGRMLGGPQGMTVALILVLAIALWKGPQIMKFFGGNKR